LWDNMHRQNDKKPVSKAIIIQTGGRITFLNKDAELLLGVRHRKQAVEKNLLDFFHPDSWEEIKNQIETIQHNGKSFNYSPKKILRLDGSTIDVEVAIDLQTLKDYSAIRLIAREANNQKSASANDKAVAMDLSSDTRPVYYRENNESRLNLDSILKSNITETPEIDYNLETENIFQILTEESFVGMFVLRDGMFVYVNPKLAEICGYSMDELTNKISLIELIVGDDNKDIETKLGIHLSDINLIQSELQLLHKDGNVIDVEINGRHSIYHGMPVIIGTVLDITHQKKCARIQSIVLQIIQIANEAEDLITFLAQIRQTLGDVFDISNFFIALYDNISSKYSFPYFDDEFDEPDSFLQEQMKHSLTDYVRRSGKSLLANKEIQLKLQNEGQYKPVGTISPIWMGVPLKITGNIIGVVSVQSYSENIQYTQCDLELLTIVSDHIATAIEKKRTEDALSISQNTLSTVMSNLPCMTFRCRPDEFLTMEFVSDGALSLTGYQPDYFIDNSKIAFSSIIHPEDRDLIHNEIDYISDESQKIQLEYRIVTAEGHEKWVWMKASVIGFKNGKVSLLEGFITDISDRKIAEDEFSKTNTLLISAIEQLPAGVIIAEAPDVNIGIVNSAAFDIRGESPLPLTEIQSSLHPSRWQIYFPDGSVCFPEELPLAKAIYFGETINDMEMIIKRETGEERWVSISASPIRNTMGEIIAGIAVFPDITNRKKMEEELRVAYEKLRNDKHKLKEKNIALRELLGQIDDEKKYIENQIQTNIDKVVMPLLRNLLDGPNSDVKQQVKVLAEHLEEITSPFVRSLQHQFSKLTPREVEICNMIRQGMTSKEIISVLNTSLDTIHQQRKIIRRKLGLTNKDINLTTYLNSL
jgi:PAS domain S-box-containing protein